ncbi:transposase family protein [Rothia terrae]|uniref:helix-turn-helix domain-containing protein n=1 Tax=Rothia terrae TaxID=396015 RepID=UPI00144830B5|nr:transposase family protein [Rothia terrae]
MLKPNQKRPLHNKRTTRLNSNQFTTLITALKQHLNWNKPATRPRALTLNQALTITLIYLRHNLTEEVLAEAIGVSQPTISRTIHHIEGALLKLKRAESSRTRTSPEYPRLTGNTRHFDSGVELVFTRGGHCF